MRSYSSTTAELHERYLYFAMFYSLAQHEHCSVHVCLGRLWVFVADITEWLFTTDKSNNKLIKM